MIGVSIRRALLAVITPLDLHEEIHRPGTRPGGA